MTTERELLKEAAKIMKSVKQVAGDVRFVNEIKNDLTVSIENIEAYLSQPDAVAMSWEEALLKIAEKRTHNPDEKAEFMAMYKRCGFTNTAEQAAHLFMESNSSQAAKQQAVAFLDSIRDYERQGRNLICFDERTSEELYEVFLKKSGSGGVLGGE